MLQPRNSLVVLRLMEESSRQVGRITVPTNKECYTHAEVIAVGPGSVSAEGGRSETFDLIPGQIVWVKHKRKLQGVGGIPKLEDEGLPYQYGDQMFNCFEQSSVLGIVKQPEVAVNRSLLRPIL